MSEHWICPKHFEQFVVPFPGGIKFVFCQYLLTVFQEQVMVIGPRWEQFRKKCLVSNVKLIWACCKAKLTLWAQITPRLVWQEVQWFWLFILRTFKRKFSSQWLFLNFLLQSDNELLVSEMQKRVGSPTSFQRWSMWKTTLILKNWHV